MKPGCATPRGKVHTSFTQLHHTHKSTPIKQEFASPCDPIPQTGGIAKNRENRSSKQTIALKLHMNLFKPNLMDVGYSAMLRWRFWWMIGLAISNDRVVCALIYFLATDDTTILCLRTTNTMPKEKSLADTRWDFRMQTNHRLGLARIDWPLPLLVRLMRFKPDIRKDVLPWIYCCTILMMWKQSIQFLITGISKTSSYAITKLDSLMNHISCFKIDQYSLKQAYVVLNVYSVLAGFKSWWID